MDMSFFLEVLKLIVILPLILMLIYISIKYGGRYMNKFNSGGIIKVHQRVPLNQSTLLSVVTIAGKPYLITSGEKGAEILMEIDKETFNKYNSQETIHNNFFNSDLVKFNFLKRKDKYEKNQ